MNDADKSSAGFSQFKTERRQFAEKNFFIYFFISFLMHKPKIAILATTSQEDIGSGLLSTIILPDAIIPDIVQRCQSNYLNIIQHILSFFQLNVLFLLVLSVIKIILRNRGAGVAENGFCRNIWIIFPKIIFFNLLFAKKQIY